MGWLTGRTALVTGASRGIGKAITLLLAEEGADIAFTYKSTSSAADEVVRAIKAKGVRAVAHQADAKDSASAEQVDNGVGCSAGRES